MVKTMVKKKTLLIFSLVAISVIAMHFISGTWRGQESETIEPDQPSAGVILPKEMSARPTTPSGSESQWVAPDKPIPPPPPVADVGKAFEAAQEGNASEWIPPSKDLPPPPPLPSLVMPMQEASHPANKSVWIKPKGPLPPAPPVPLTDSYATGSKDRR